MPTQAYFARYPPFPPSIPCAELPRISFSKLFSHNEAESNSLFEACQDQGFFLLDLDTCERGRRFLEKAEKMFDLIDNLYDLEVEELMEYGYKPPGMTFGYASFQHPKQMGEPRPATSKPHIPPLSVSSLS